MKKISELATAALPAPLEETRRGYMARELVQCTLPHSKPAQDVFKHKRVDGNLTMSITADPEVGLPYGAIPRLLMLWVTSEAMRTQNRRIELGTSLNQFLREVGLNPETGGGKRGDAKRMRDQMVRLFRARISFEYKQGTATAGGLGWVDMAVAPKGYLWWDFNQPEQTALFDSWIELSEDFYKAITANAVPVNLAMAGQLKKSPLALDLFVWTAYRLFRMKEGEEITIPLTALQHQFGTDYGRSDHFKPKLMAALAKIKTVWPDAPMELGERGLELTGIAPRNLPVQPEISMLLPRRKGADPFDLPARDLIDAGQYAGNWEVRALRREWAAWCKSQGITPEKPLGHFVAFVKEHVRRNGKG